MWMCHVTNTNASCDICEGHRVHTNAVTYVKVIKYTRMHPGTRMDVKNIPRIRRCHAIHIDRYVSEGSIKLKVSFAKEPHKRDDILQKRPIWCDLMRSITNDECVLSHP